MKILVGINNLTSIQQPAYANHIQLFYNLGKKHPDWKVYFGNPSRMSIDRMRNWCAVQAMELECDWLVFVDDDVLVPPDAIDQLLNGNYPVASGVTMIRSYPYYPMIFDFSNPDCHYVVDFAEKADNHGWLECDAVGFSLCAIQVSLLREMEAPYFITGPNFTEDVYFCKKVRREKPDAKIAANVRLHTGHIVGPEIIFPSEVELQNEFEEKKFPGLKEAREASNKTKRDDRGDAYQKLIEDLKNATV